MTSTEIKDADNARLFQQVPKLSELKGTRILVTGCTGFIPGALTEFLLFLNREHNFQIQLMGLCRSLEKARSRFGDQLKTVISDFKSPLELSEKFDFIFHGASPANPANFFRTDDLRATNVSGTENLIGKAERFVFLGTGEVYGEGAGTPMSETLKLQVNPDDPRAIYAFTKLNGEKICQAHHSQGRWARVGRIFHTYGPGVPLHDGRMQNDFIGDAVQRKNLILKSHGTARRSLCYITDTLAGLLTLALEPAEEMTFNIGNSSVIVTVAEFAQILAKLAKVDVEKHIGNDEIPRHAGSYSAPDTHRIEALGWKPLVNLQDGLIRTLRTYNVDV